MTLWIGLGALVVIGLLCLLIPVFPKKSTPAGRGAEVRWLALGVVAALPALTVGVYLYLGAPGILKEQALLRAHSDYDVEGMIKALENKLKATPNDPEGWYALGRAYIGFGRYPEAEDALRKAVTQAPKDAKIIAQYAEAIALKQGSLDGRPMELIRQALDISYEETKALELAGLEAFQNERWAEALHYWRRLLALLPKDSEHHEAIAQGIRTTEANLQIRLGGTLPVPKAPAEPRQTPH